MGGIDNGVQVSIKATLDAGAGATKVEFLTRDRKSAFTFDVDAATNTITRSADDSFNAPSFSSGTAPAVNGETTFVFTKRRNEMAVTINGERFPWYDYATLTSNPLLTHVSVYSGMKDAEVTLTRPRCETECHPAECRDAAGINVCKAPNGTGCVSVTASDSAGVATECSARQTSANGNEHCCDGTAVTPPVRDFVDVEKFAMITENPAYLTKVCTAFGIDPCLDSSLVGTKVQVKSVNSSTGMYSVFAPTALKARTQRPDHILPASTMFTLPKFALSDTFMVSESSGELASGSNGAWDADHFWDVIFRDDNMESLPAGWYVHFIEMDLRSEFNESETRLVKFTKKADNFRAVIGGKIFAGDEPIDPAEKYECTNMPFIDSKGDGCDSYDGRCNIHGYPTQAGCQLWYNSTCDANSKLPAGNNTEKNLGEEAAAIQCCSCGGGKWTLKAANLIHA